MEPGFFTTEPDYEQIRKGIYGLKRSYPFINTFAIGASAVGRGIYAVSAGNLENATLYCGAFHGQEWLTSLLLFRFADDLFRAVQSEEFFRGADVKRALTTRGIVIIPCVNPDGVEIALHHGAGAGILQRQVEEISGGDYHDWNANARGVDINHNFDAGWAELHKLEQEQGVYGPSPRRYGGAHAGSETETRALCRYCREHPMEKAFAFHSQGEEIYYSYGEASSPREKIIAQILANSSGYTLAEPEPIASHGGFKDWFIKEFGKPGFTVEVGKGQNPLPITDFPAVYEKIAEMMILGFFL